MVILTDRELAFLATLGDNGERLYRNEIGRLLREQAGRRGRLDIERMRARRSGSRRAGGRTRPAARGARRDPRGGAGVADRQIGTPWTR
jgi:hypothetical protein